MYFVISTGTAVLVSPEIPRKVSLNSCLLKYITVSTGYSIDTLLVALDRCISGIPQRIYSLI